MLPFATKHCDFSEGHEGNVHVQDTLQDGTAAHNRVSQTLHTKLGNTTRKNGTVKGATRLLQILFAAAQYML